MIWNEMWVHMKPEKKYCFEYRCTSLFSLSILRCTSFFIFLISADTVCTFLFSALIETLARWSKFHSFHFIILLFVYCRFLEANSPQVKLHTYYLTESRTDIGWMPPRPFPLEYFLVVDLPISTPFTWRGRLEIWSVLNGLNYFMLSNVLTTPFLFNYFSNYRGH